MYLIIKLLRRGVCILAFGTILLLWFKSLSNDKSTFNSKKLSVENNKTMNIVNSSKENLNEVNNLINLTNFDYLINQPSCYNYRHVNETKLITVILIHSAPEHLEKREVVRQTWGSQKDPRSRMFFVLGATNSSSLQAQLTQENDQFHDLIQGNFLDSYHNLTYKHVMSLKWFNDNCSNVKFLFRADDDIFVNLPHIYSLLVDISHLKNVIVCQRRDRAAVLRTFTKWKISKNDYAFDYYPPYCFGYAIFYTNDVVKKLYQAAQKSRYFWIDDVHITGTLRKRLNIPILSFEKHYYLNEKQTKDLIDGKIHVKDIKPRILFVKPNQEGKIIQKLWDLVLEEEGKHKHPMRK